jgi:fatty acid desaturase
MLAPHFLYRAVHLTHHSTGYASPRDGEYIGFGRSRSLIAGHFFYNFVIPFLSAARFTIIAPLSVLHPRLRAFVVRKMSFMGLRFSLDRAGPTSRRETLEWWLGEGAATAFCWSLVVAAAIGSARSAVATLVIEWYLVMVVVLAMNSARSLGATHGYTREGEPLGFESQILDSISIESTSILTRILCPVGTQYHALHHVFPKIPYHSLAEAYVRLRSEFPNETLLTETARRSLFEVWGEFVRVPPSRSQVTPDAQRALAPEPGVR